MIFDALSNAAYCVSLRGPGAELEEGSQEGARQVVEKRPGRARVKPEARLYSIAYRLLCFVTYLRPLKSVKLTAYTVLRIFSAMFARSFFFRSVIAESY